MVIDRKIHFIWMGAVIPDEYAEEILGHLDNNSPPYVINLWTDKPVDSCAKFADVATLRYGSDFKKGGVRQAGDRVILDFSCVNKQTRRTDSKSISFINISTLDDECGQLKQRYVDALDIKNYGRASDVLRLVILRREGGIYMDTDVESKASLPAVIDSSDGFMMGYGQAGKPSFTNAVMAASSQGDFVESLIASIQSTFQHWDDKNWWQTNNSNIAKSRKALEDAKANKAGVTDLHNKRTQYQKAMENGTLAVTGPTKVELFLYKRMLGADAVDPLTWMNDMLEESHHSPSSFNEVMGQFKLLVAKPAMKARGVVSRYSFPMDYITIRSDASWM